MPEAAPIVVKIGGSTLGSHDTTLEDIGELQRRGERVVVVHGGGAAVSAALEASGLPVRFHDGLRVTDAPTLELVISVAAGTINTSLVSQLAAGGTHAVGLTGIDGPTLLCRLTDPELGLVGSVERVDTALVQAVLAAGVVPVMAPIGMLAGHAGEWRRGQPLNLNADTVAGHVAAALRARALLLLTDTDGVRDDRGERISTLDGERYRALTASGVIGGGMLPKTEAAFVAARAGVSASIADGRRAGALPAALAGGTGTRITD